MDATMKGTMTAYNIVQVLEVNRKSDLFNQKLKSKPTFKQD